MIAIFLLVTCDNYEFPKSPYPRIETLPVVNISKTGVTFQANITQQGKLPIINHGFVWGHTENPTINSQDKIQLGSTSKTGNFEATVQSGLSDGETYYVRAFVATADYFVYGENESFVSKGSTPPLIKVLSAIEGTAADTIVIEGKYFSALAENNKVKFGQETSIVLASTDSAIQCIVPNLTANQDYSISVNVAGNLTTSEIKFHVLQPKIESMIPLVGVFGDIITLNGENFPIKKDYINLTLDGIACEVLNVSKSAISFVLPNNLNKSNNQVTARISKVNVSAGELTVAPPTIDNVTNSVLTMYTNPALVISGSNFNPIAAKNEVRIGGYLCNILSSSLNQLTIQPPREIIPEVSVSVKDTFDIEVKVLDQFVGIENKIRVTYLSTWTKKRNFPGVARANAVAFSANNKGYVGTGVTSDNQALNDFWEYDPESDEWKRVDDFPGGQRARAVAFSISNVGYVGLGISDLNIFFNDFYQYKANQWTRVSDFPGGGRYSSASFTINNMGFVGAGESDSYNPTDDFWAYNPNQNDWTQISDLPNSTSFAVGLNIGDEGYIYDYSVLYKFNGNGWEKKNAVVLQSWDNIGFSIGNLGYFGLGLPHQLSGSTDLYEYNPQLETSINRPIPQIRHGAVVFTINNKAYVIGGITYDNVLGDVWEFDPTKPQ